MRTLRMWLILFIGAFSSHAWSQTLLDDSAQLEQKIYAAYLKATAGIDAPTISVDAVLAHVQSSQFILVDVRKDAEIAISHIPGALSVDEFNRTYKSNALPKDTTVVAYCTIGYRSGKFAEKLIAQGIPVRNLAGGILAWARSHGALVHRDATGIASPTTTVHVYGQEWNLLPPGYQAVW